MRFFTAAAIALLALTTGCSMFKPAEAPKTDVDDGSQWTGFNNGYAKGEEPKKNVPATKAANSEAPKVDDKSSDSKVEDKIASADEEKPSKKKPGAKKAGAKKSSGAPAAKPRKRAPKKA